MSQSSQLIDTAQRTIQLETEAVEQLRSRIDERFVLACELILACKGRVAYQFARDYAGRGHTGASHV